MATWTASCRPTEDRGQAIQNNPFPQRKSPRKSGVYFVTICTYQREHLFGHITDGAMILNAVGEITKEELERIPQYWRIDVDVDLFVVMPNHLHMIVVLHNVGTAFLPSGETQITVSDAENRVPTLRNSETDLQKRSPALGTVVGSYKSGVTRRVREADGKPELIVWQTRYHDRIIRNKREYNYIRRYVLVNPAKWHEDTFYQSN